MTATADRHAESLRALLGSLGEDPTRPELERTPARVVETLRHLLAGYREDPVKLLGESTHPAPHRDMVVVRDIEVSSLCEHHMLPFFGSCHVGYIPSDRVAGLSRIPRAVEALARRLTMQERLTREIATAIESALAPMGVGVIVEATHLCMRMRGAAAEQRSFAVTSAMLGCFGEPAVRAEFLSHVRDARAPISR